jgi:hypothetical protein
LSFEPSETKTDHPRPHKRAPLRITVQHDNRTPINGRRSVNGATRFRVLLKTLVGNYSSSVSKMARDYQATSETPHGARKCVQTKARRDDGKQPLIARFGWYSAHVVSHPDRNFYL